MAIAEPYGQGSGLGDCLGEPFLAGDTIPRWGTPFNGVPEEVRQPARRASAAPSGAAVPRPRRSCETPGMRLHLVDGTFELFRAHYSKRPAHPMKASRGLAQSLL